MMKMATVIVTSENGAERIPQIFTYFSTSCKTKSLDCGLPLLLTTIGRRFRDQAYKPTERSPTEAYIEMF